MAIHHGIAGAFFSVAWFFFFDGMTLAKEITPGDYSYKFVMWLPGILGVLAMIMMTFVDARMLMNQDQEDLGPLFGGGGGDSENAEQRSKITFFFAATIALAGVSISVWQMSDTYKKEPWPGLALLFQTLCLIMSSGVIFVTRGKARDSGM